MTPINYLEFRRQFLFTPKNCNQLPSWQHELIGAYNLYVHPDCQLNKISTPRANLFLLGYAVNPHFTSTDSAGILNEISTFKSIQDIPLFLNPLVGRFVLIVNYGNDSIFYNDACGLKSIYYTINDKGFFAASQPALLKLVVNLTRSRNYEEYYGADHIKTDKEHWLPSGVSLFKDVYHLVPNHSVSSVTGKQIRYWPIERRDKLTLDEAVEKMSYLLKNTMLGASKQFQVAISLTAGIDSRAILSSSRDIADDVLFYTLKYRNLNEQSDDLRIPQSISSKLGLNYKVFNCKKDRIDESFQDIYVKNTDISHFHDWGEIANEMFYEYPQERVAVRGNCAEIGRCCLYRQGFHPRIKSISQFLRLSPGWNNIDFIKFELEKWFEEIVDVNRGYDYDILDLFYWEHRMGSWQAQSQLEWDIVQEAFSPFNNRELIECMLAVDTKYRRDPSYVLFEKTIEKLWKDVLTEPINPKTDYGKVKVHAKYVFAYLGILGVMKSLNGFLMNF